MYQTYQYFNGSQPDPNAHNDIPPGITWAPNGENVLTHLVENISNFFGDFNMTIPPDKVIENMLHQLNPLDPEPAEAEELPFEKPREEPCS